MNQSRLAAVDILQPKTCTRLDSTRTRRTKSLVRRRALPILFSFGYHVRVTVAVLLFRGLLSTTRGGQAQEADAMIPMP